MSDLPLNQILCGDCVEVLKDFPDDSIDLVVTDPPYGLSFMGKDWDKTLPPREAFDEIIRVLKPGALSFVMSSPRQDLLWRMLAMLEGVGFELTQSYIDWIYKTGFPKAYDVSKGIDRKFGIKQKAVGKYIHPRQKEKGTLRDEWPAGEYDQSKNRNTYGYFEGGPDHFAITEPSSDLAKEWNGWKSQTGLKPAHEPILMVNKPFSESTIVDNVLRWDTGAINVDACRIPFQNEDDKFGAGWYKTNTKNDGEKFTGLSPKKGWHNHNMKVLADNPEKRGGRFPANLLVSDKAIDTGKTSKSIGGITKGKLGNRIYGSFENIKSQDGEGGYGDVGDQSRYFDLDAWAEHYGFLDVPKPDNKERDFGLKGKKQVPKSKFNLNDGSKDKRFDGVIPTPRRNVHPTVKPIKLMAYLIELGCPPDGVVLDPFVGSGTTCIAAKRLHRRYIGIEINPEYHRMAKARVSAYPVPLSWFSGSETEDVLDPPKVINDFSGLQTPNNSRKEGET